MARNQRAQDRKEEGFHTVCRDGRLMGVCEQKRSKDPKRVKSVMGYTSFSVLGRK